MDHLQAVLVITGLVVQALLAVFALWYTIETRALRLQASAQLKLIGRQHLLAVAPFLMVSVTTKSELVQSIEAQQDSPEKAERLESANALPQETFVCAVENPTSRIALHAEGVIYVAESKHFLEGEKGLACIGEKEDYEIWFGEDPLTQKEVVDSTTASFPNATKIDGDLLDHADESYSVIFFKDIEESVYCVKRAFYTDEDGDTILRKPQFLKLS